MGVRKQTGAILRLLLDFSTSGFRRRPKDDVKPGRQLTNTRFLDGGKIYSDQSPGCVVTDSSPDPVLLIAKCSFDEELGCVGLAALHFDFEVDVRGRASGIGQRLDCAEVVFASRSRQKPAKALEMGIELNMVR